MKQGVINISLVANAGSTPTSYYSVSYSLSGGLSQQENWVVPVSATPVVLATIRTNPPPVVTYSTLATSLLTGTLQAAQFPALTGDVTTVAGALATTLSATGVSGGTYGDSTHVARITVDNKGRLTAVSSVLISGGGGGGTPCTVTSLSVQFNNAGSFGCMGEFTYASSTLTATAGTVDFTAATATSAFRTGTSLPATCAVGNLFFKSDATPGQNIYMCQSTNNWTQQLNSGTGSPCTTTALGLQFNSAGSFGCLTNATYVLATGVLSINQKADTNGTIYGKRFTDTTPTGTWLQFQDAAAVTDLFKVDTAGTVSATSFQSLDTVSSGIAIFNGLTSGTVALAAADVAGTSIAYVLPSTNGAANQFLMDNGSTTCPTLASGSPTTCHQLIWSSSLLATGIVDGLAPVTITTGNSATLGAGTYRSGYTFNQNVTAGTGVTYTLPATAAGKQYCVKNSDVTGTARTGVITVAVPASSYLHLNGARGTISSNVTSGGAAGDAACFVAIDSTNWEVYPSVGSWTLH